eukprot:TRINITY_DN103496_c0_g1_i1.p1 TRINITY_DN103496_c0_g1~~TRINITY_DN103496_c0_g1_i1.p1  ORF type:complete len:260 (+),score=45.52 TRINITY_DN103496_c0_g1_i1:128-907(+)
MGGALLLELPLELLAKVLLGTSAAIGRGLDTLHVLGTVATAARRAAYSEVVCEILARALYPPSTLVVGISCPYAKWRALLEDGNKHGGMWCFVVQCDSVFKDNDTQQFFSSRLLRLGYCAVRDELQVLVEAVGDGHLPPAHKAVLLREDTAGCVPGRSVVKTFTATCHEYAVGMQHPSGQQRCRLTFPAEALRSSASGRPAVYFVYNGDATTRLQGSDFTCTRVCDLPPACDPEKLFLSATLPNGIERRAFEPRPLALS